MKFNMCVKNNFASFNDGVGVMIFIDSFDNKNFAVRMGTIESSELVGTITVKSDSDLNTELEKLYLNYKGQ